MPGSAARRANFFGQPPKDHTERVCSPKRVARSFPSPEFQSAVTVRNAHCSQIAPPSLPCGSGRFLSRSPNDRPGTEDITRRPGHGGSLPSRLPGSGGKLLKYRVCHLPNESKTHRFLPGLARQRRSLSRTIGRRWNSLEIGYACGQGKPVVAYAEDLSIYRDKVFRSGWTESSNEARDRHGNEIEDFGGIDNLMITQSVIEICPTFEEAATALKRFLDQ